MPHPHLYLLILFSPNPPIFQTQIRIHHNNINLSLKSSLVTTPMSIKNHQTKVPMILNWILVLVCVTTPIKAIQTRKLDETTAPSTTTGDEKCTPCGTPNSSPPPILYPSPPPPILYPSPPPPPPLIYPSPPPPSPKKPPSQYCPPPPSSYIFITGPPGPNLYPVDQDFNGSSPRHYGSFSAFLPLLVGLFSLLTFW